MLALPSMRSIFSLLLATGLGILTSCNDETDLQPDTATSADVFTIKAGGSGSDYATGITTDALGNTYMTGQFSGTARFDAQEIISSGAENMFLAKYDSLGKLLWVRQGGGENHDEGRAVKTDAAGNVYVCGYFQGTAVFGATTFTSSGGLDIFVAKYSSEGTLLWVKKAGGEGYDRAYAMDMDASGNLYVTGQFTELAFFSSSKVIYAGDDAGGSFLVKYNPDGEVNWVRSASGTSYNESNSLVVNAAGESFLAGSFVQTIQFGTISLTSAGEVDVFLAKYDADGIPLWAKREGGLLNDSNRGITLDASGNIFLTGFFKGTSVFGATSLTSSGEEDIFLAKYNSAGTGIWAVKTGGTMMDRSYSINHDVSGNLYLTGNFRGTVSFGVTSLTANGEAEIFLAQYTSGGDVAWARKAGGTGEDGGYSTSIDARGNITMGGYFQNIVLFGTTELTSSGSHDIFLWKMKPQN